MELATQDKRDRGNVWFLSLILLFKKVDLIQLYFLEETAIPVYKNTWSKKRYDIVYDPFMGIGTTALASIRLGVNYIGTDIDVNYIKVAIDNIQNRKKEMVIGRWLPKDSNDVVIGPKLQQ